MTVVLSTTFPNGLLLRELTQFDEDPGEWDTTVVPGMTGKTFRNGRRSVPVGRWRFTIMTMEDSATFTAALSVKNAAQGMLYGFKWVHPRTGTTHDVAFTKDGWFVKILPGRAPGSRMVQIDVELEQVIGGTAATT
jgi:hypothetical protein